jgi:hypothetical protein
MTYAYLLFPMLKACSNEMAPITYFLPASTRSVPQGLQFALLLLGWHGAFNQTSLNLFSDLLTYLGFFQSGH